MGFPGGTSGKEHTCQCRRHKRCGFSPWVGKILWRRAWQPLPVFLPGESYGQRSLGSYSPWGSKELDLTINSMHVLNVSAKRDLNQLLTPFPHFTDEKTSREDYPQPTGAGAQVFWLLVLFFKSLKMLNLKTQINPSGLSCLWWYDMKSHFIDLLLLSTPQVLMEPQYF